MKPADRHALALHLTFAALAGITLAVPFGASVGLRLCVLVLLYNLALPIAAWRLKHQDWLNLWLFLAPLSIMQVLPDWFLASVLRVLRFPDTGAPMVGPVPVYMAGLWAIPLFVILLVSRRLGSVGGKRVKILTATVASAVLFLGSEATLWRIPIWHAVNVTTVGHIALYLILPEIGLGIHTLLAFEATRTRSIWMRLTHAWLIMAAYTGNACLAYLAVERLLIGQVLAAS